MRRLWTASMLSSAAGAISSFPIVPALEAERAEAENREKERDQLPLLPRSWRFIEREEDGDGGCLVALGGIRTARETRQWIPPRDDSISSVGSDSLFQFKPSLRSASILINPKEARPQKLKNWPSWLDRIFNWRVLLVLDSSNGFKLIF